MKKIQVDFCIREQNVPGNKNWPRGGGGWGAFSRDFTINLSPQCWAFIGAFKTEPLKAHAILRPVGAGITNDWCMIYKLDCSFISNNETRAI